MLYIVVYVIAKSLCNKVIISWRKFLFPVVHLLVPAAQELEYFTRKEKFFLSLHSGLVAHQAEALPSFYSMKQQSSLIIN